MNSLASLLHFGPLATHASRSAYFTAPHTRRFHAVDHHRARAILLCHCFILKGSAGISTCCPSPTTCVLGLGPDLPWADEPSPGNLGPSTGMFLTCLSLLIPAFSLVHCPHVLSVMLQPMHIAPLPLHTISRIKSAASVTCFSPGHLRRTTTRPVSYYALFQCMAASKPTSWLSVQFHILFHLTCTWGP